MLLRKLVTPFSMSSTPASHLQWSAGFALRGARPEAVRDKSPTTSLAGTFSLTPLLVYSVKKEAAIRIPPYVQD